MKKFVFISNAVMKNYIPIFLCLTFYTFLSSNVELMVFSFNRPLQIYALLESIEKHMGGCEAIHIIYRSDDIYESGYQECFERFNELPLQLYRQGLEPHADFKPLVMKALNSMRAEYVLFSVDDALVTDNIDLSETVRALHDSCAYTFHLRMGKNINYCYMRSKPSLPPALSIVCDKVYAWQFNRGRDDWEYQNTLDMGLYRRRECLADFEKLQFNHPNKLEGAWSGLADLSRFGLCYEFSRVVTLPINIVNPSQNLHLGLFTIKQLLAKFNEGLKLDISHYYRYRNRSPHVGDRLPYFVARD